MSADGQENEQLAAMFEETARYCNTMAKALRGEKITVSKGASTKRSNKGFTAEQYDALCKMVSSAPDEVYDPHQLKKEHFKNVPVPEIRKQLNLFHAAGKLTNKPMSGARAKKTKDEEVKAMSEDEGSDNDGTDEESESESEPEERPKRGRGAKKKVVPTPPTLDKKGAKKATSKKKRAGDELEAPSKKRKTRN